MLSLGFDTTTGWGALGLVRDDTVLGETGCQIGRNQAEQLLPALAELMSRCGLAPSDLDLIAAGCGPGSYTGLRIGLAVAEALGLALNRPVTGVGTLEAIAQNAAGFPGPVIPVIAARRGEVYTAVYEGENELHPPSILTPAELHRLLTGLNRACVFVCGSGMNLLAPWPRDGPVQLIFGRPEQGLPRGAVLAGLGARRPYRPLIPLYLRRTEAEEKAEVRAADGCERRPDGAG